MANVLSIVWAGAVHLLHGHLEWLGQQLFADTSEREFLIRQAATYGITPTPATFSSGTVLATGTDPNPIPLSTILVRDDGATYEVTTGTVISGGSASVAVQAITAGAAGDMDSGDTLVFESPLTGVDSTTTVEAAGLTGGNDEEETEAFRSRFLLRLQEPPEGGNDQDYEAWALEVAGVTRVWVYRHEDGLGTVTVRFVRDGDSPIIPDAGEVTAVQTALDAERPTTAEVTAAAPVDDPIAFTISITPDTPAIRAAVTAELEDLFLREAAPGDGAGFGTIFLSAVYTAVGVAEGVDDYVVSVPVGPANIVPALGDLPSVGVITWV